MLAALGWLAGVVVAAASAAFATAEIGGALLEVIDSGSEYSRAVRDTETIDRPSGDAAYQRIQEAHRNGHQRQAVAIHNATRSVVKEALVGRLDEELKPSLGRLGGGDDSAVGFGEVDLAADVWEATHPDADGDSPGPGGQAGAGPTTGGPADPRVIVFRGQVEIGVAEGPTGNLIMTENEVVLRAPKDGGPLQGTMLLQWDDFAIGQFASGLAEGIAEGLFTTSSPAQRTEEEAILATCESDIRISGTFEGVFDAGISKLSGTVTYTTDFLSNMRCARPLTAGMKQKVAAARISTSATWEALYDGVRNASGKMDPPASISFRLAVDP